MIVVSQFGSCHARRRNPSTTAGTSARQTLNGFRQGNQQTRPTLDKSVFDRFASKTTQLSNVTVMLMRLLRHQHSMDADENSASPQLSISS